MATKQNSPEILAFFTIMKLKIIIVTLCLQLAVFIVTTNCNEQCQQIMTTWKTSIKEKQTWEVRDLVEIFRLTILSQQPYSNGFEAKANVTSFCMTCMKYLPTLADKVDANGCLYDSVVEFAKWLCIAKQIQPTERACIGTVETLKHVFRSVILPMSKQAPETMCSTLTKLDCGKSDDPTRNWWSVDIPPKTRSPRSLHKRSSNGDTFTILHVSDVHLDLQYSTGSPAVCTEWLCCRYDSPKQTVDSPAAGPIGEYKCDLPASTLKLLLDHISKEHEIDAVYVTGDFTPHDDWYQTKDAYLATMGTVNRIFSNAFSSTPVFMVIGNHDTVPPNKQVFIFPSNNCRLSNILFCRFPNPAQSKTDNMTWLYDFLAHEWGSTYNWIPQGSMGDLKRAGIYNTQVRPGLRVIGINNMGCEPRNWWLYLNSVDPENVLNSLVQWLSEAEENGDRVHLIMHIDAGATGYICFIC